MFPNEAKTRKEQIDPALAKAGWNVKNPAQVAIELYSGPLCQDSETRIFKV